jgi:hypothetical protein
MVSTCHPANDDLFGPFIQGCRSNFDFTLLFEQSILSIPPAALLLVLAPPRLVRLIQSRRKTGPTPIRSIKSVSAIMKCEIQFWRLLDSCTVLDWNPAGSFDYLDLSSSHTCYRPSSCPVIRSFLGRHCALLVRTQSDPAPNSPQSVPSILFGFRCGSSPDSISPTRWCFNTWSLHCQHWHQNGVTASGSKEQAGIPQSPI